MTSSRSACPEEPLVRHDQSVPSPPPDPDTRCRPGFGATQARRNALGDSLNSVDDSARFRRRWRVVGHNCQGISVADGDLDRWANPYSGRFCLAHDAKSPESTTGPGRDSSTKPRRRTVPGSYFACADRRGGTHPRNAEKRTVGGVRRV